MGFAALAQHSNGVKTWIPAFLFVYLFYLLFMCLHVCMCGSTSVMAHMWKSEDKLGVDSVLPLCGFWGLVLKFLGVAASAFTHGA